MSRAINLPSQSVKLTNVATVRLTVGGKRFEVACYKNKVLDYRAGLETDLSEVLQTSNIHVFTSVAKGEFAAASDLHRAFGEHATQNEIAVQILQHGKSVQVSEVERAQLYESCLAQIATQIATNCVNPATGKPYTASQIRHALTQQHNPAASTTTGDDAGSKGKKGKKHSNKKQQQKQKQSLSFTVQPHKPMKQQYLQALKYLQAAEILPIQRAGMELQWQYDPTTQEEAVAAALRALDIATSTVTTTAATTDSAAAEAGDAATTTVAAAAPCTCTRTFTVDPSVYRPLQELADSTVPGSRLEILRQQVFQASAPSSAPAKPAGNSGNPNKAKKAASSSSNKADGQRGDGEEPDDGEKSDESAITPLEEKDSSDDMDDDFTALRQKTTNHRRANKRQQKRMAQRRRRGVPQHGDDGDDSDSDDDGSDRSEADEDSESDEPVATEINEGPAAAAVKKGGGGVAVPQRKIALPPDPVPTTRGGANNAGSSGGGDGTEGSEGKGEKMFTCNTCVGASNSFATQADYRAHFRSDWHRFNQKLKLQGAGAVSLQEFEQCDSESFFAATSPY